MPQFLESRTDNCNQMVSSCCSAGAELGTREEIVRIIGRVRRTRDAGRGTLS